MEKQTVGFGNASPNLNPFLEQTALIPIYSISCRVNQHGQGSSTQKLSSEWDRPIELMIQEILLRSHHHQQSGTDIQALISQSTNLI